MNPHLLLLLVYSLVLIAVGLCVGKAVSGTSQFFVADRALGPGLLFSTMLAANIGAGSTVGATGLGYRYGVSAWWWVGSAGIGSLALGLAVGPAIWRLAKQHDMRTVGDFLEHRYGPVVRGVVASVLWLGTVVILAAQLIAIAWVLNVVAGVSKPLGCLIGGLVMVVYFTAGGLLASAWVNLIQLAVLMAGFVLIVPLAVNHAGGWTQVLEATSQQPGYLSFWKNGPSGWGYLPLLAPAFIVSPGLLQKIFGARDAKTVRKAVTAQGAVLLGFATIPMALGVVAKASYPGLDNPELALPKLFIEGLPIWVGALGLAAIFSAEVSSADAILFMLATSLSQDLYRRFLRPASSDKDLLRVARLAAAGGGSLGVVLAILFPTIIMALTVFYALLTVCLFVPVVAGLYSRAGTQLEALCSIFAGLLLTATLYVCQSSGFFPWAHPTVAGLGGAAVAFAGASVFRLLRHRTRVSV